MGLDLTSLSSLTSSLGALVPNSSDILQNVALGAATSVVMAGMKSQAGADALDPLQLFHKDAPQVSPANNPNAVVGATITASAFAALPAGTQAQLTAAGVHIVAG
jgi:hypothetical protein